MQSGNQPPNLNNGHISAIRSVISNNIDVIKLYLTKLGKSTQEIIDFLNKAIETSISEEDEKKYLENKVANESGLFRDLPICSMQLSAVFNPNFTILNKIGVINSPRDKECKITPEEFAQYKNPIRECSIISLDRILRRKKDDLSQHRKNITIISTLVSEDVDDEFNKIVQKAK